MSFELLILLALGAPTRNTTNYSATLSTVTLYAGSCVGLYEFCLEILATSSQAQCHCSFDEELERAYLSCLHWGSKGGYHNGFYEEKEWIKVTMPGFG